MTIDLELAYIGLEVSDVDQWETFGRDILGMMSGRDEDGTLSFRMDHQGRRFILSQGPLDDLSYSGWLAPDRDAYEAVLANLNNAKIPYEVGSATEAATRQVDEFVHFFDPNDIRTELCLGAHKAEEDFSSALVPNGFVTGDQGLGHMALVVKDRAASTRFFCDIMGMRLSDYIEAEIMGFPIELTFLHANPRHHCLALTAAPLPKRIHHIMLEVPSQYNVGKAYDQCLETKQPISLTLGVHPNDKMFSFYVTSPSGFDIEFGACGMQIDDANWKVNTFDKLSLWGHRPVGLLGEIPR